MILGVIICVLYFDNELAHYIFNRKRCDEEEKFRSDMIGGRFKVNIVDMDEELSDRDFWFPPRLFD